MDKPKRCLFADVMDPGRCQIILLIIGNWFKEEEMIQMSPEEYSTVHREK